MTPADMTPTDATPTDTIGGDSQTAEIGTVYLVGAGPGDPGLLTVRGRSLLYSCNAIVYDRLAAPCLPSDLGSDVDLHYVGKRADHHALPQDEINKLLVELARRGQQVCRLKGGDPFVFGRGGEEAEALHWAGVRFEVVPGVTAGVAAPAYAGIPVTHRGEAVRVTLVTAHEDPSKGTTQMDWRCFGHDANGTIAAYMPVANLPHIAAELIAGGLDAATPSAVIEHGTLPSQRTVTAPLAELAERVAAADIKPPALLVVGRTVALHDRLTWYEEGPLCGKRVIVTRPADQARRLITALRRLGVEPLICPSIMTEPADPAELEPVRDRLDSYDWIFFTSENGVRYFFRLLAAGGLDLRAIAGAKFAAVGSGTADRLERYHLRADFLPTAFRGEVLLQEFCALNDPAGLRILRVRGDRAPTTLEEGLRGAGAEVDTLLGYYIKPARLRADVADAIAVEGADAVTFTSGSSVEGFEQLMPAHGLHATATAVCIGPVTAAAAERAGWRNIVTAAVSTVPGLIACTESVLSEERET